MSDAALLTLTQWLSPAFPLGGFAYSQGLEWAMSEGLVADAGAVSGWLSDLIGCGSAWCDAVLLSLALRPGADHDALADLARAICPSRERLAETEEMGRAFTLATNALTGSSHVAAPLPVALGRAAATLDLAPERVIALYLQSTASTLVQAAVRFIPLGQTDGQRVLAGLHGLIEATAARAAAAGPADLGTSTLMADMAGMAHETMEVRLFRS